MAVTTVVLNQLAETVFKTGDLLFRAEQFHRSSARHDLQFRKFPGQIIEIGVGGTVKIHRIDGSGEVDDFFAHTIDIPQYCYLRII